MSWWHSIPYRLAALLRRRAEDEEMDEELAFHLEMETQKNLRAGMSPGEARRRALIAFGGVAKHREAVREARGLGWADALSRDLRFTARRLLRERGFCASVVVTLALGIGALTASFALVRGVLLRPLPYPDADRVVAIEHAAPGLGVESGGISEGLHLHYREHARSFSALGIYAENDGVALSGGGEPEQVRAALVTPSVLSILRARPHLGRLLTEADTAIDSRTVMIGHALWRRRFGGDPGIVGRAVELNRRPYRVVGVLPPGFDFPDPRTQVWYAIGARASQAGIRDLWYRGVARLEDGVSPAAAEAELRRLIPGLADAYPDVTADLLRDSGLGARVRPLREVLVEGVRSELVLLLCAGGLLLVIAFANVANLFLVRAERHRHEAAVERALGAGGGDLARRRFGESLLLALAGGALGLGATALAVRARFGLDPFEIPRLHDLRLGGATLALAAGLVLAFAVALGALSLVRTRLGDLPAALKAGRRITGGREARRAQRLLIAVQVALALSLLAGSATMARSLWRLTRVDPGFRAGRALAVSLPLPFSPYPTYRAGAGFYHRVLEGLREVPGVTAAEAVSQLPLTPIPAGFLQEVGVDGERLPRGEIPPDAMLALATPGYFRTMGIPFLRGRTFEPEDLAREEAPAVIAASLARTLFGDADPIGRRIRLPRGSGDQPPFRVVGVVGDVAAERLGDPPVPALYLPIVFDARPGAPDWPGIRMIPSDLTVVVRGDLPPLAAARSVRRAVDAVDPRVPLARVRPLEGLVSDATRQARLTTLLLLVAAGSALLLGVVGIHGVLSYAVAQRAPEMGVRMALGADPARVVRMVVREGALLAGAGIVAGVPAALALSRLLRGLLFEVGPGDPAVLAGTAALLLAVALAASWLPARRAGRIDPTEVLRAD